MYVVCFSIRPAGLIMFFRAVRVTILVVVGAAYLPVVGSLSPAAPQQFDRNDGVSAGGSSILLEREQQPRTGQVCLFV